MEKGFCMKRLNKYTFLLSIILSFISIISIMVVVAAKDDKNIRISLSDTSAHSHYKILNIRIGETDYPLETFVSDNLEYVDGALLVNGSNYDFEIKTSAIDNVIISFLAEKNSADVNVIEHSKYGNNEISFDLNNGNDSYDLYYSNITIKEVLYDGIKNLTIPSVIMYIGIFLIQFFVLYICISYIKYIFNKQSNEDLNFKNILLFIGSMFIVIFSSVYFLLEILNILLVVPIVLSCIFIFYKYKIRSLHNLFLIYGTIFGLIILFLLPPFHVPDEGAHFYKSYRLSYFNSDKLVVNDAGTDKAKMYVNSNVSDLVHQYMIDIHSESYTLSAKNYFSNLTKSINNTDVPRRQVFFGNTEIINPFCYIPTAILMFICRISGISVLVSFLLGRLVNFSIFILSGYYALKKIPIFKNVLFITMVLPICLQQEAAFNQDTITNSIIFLLFANIIYLIYGDYKKITIKQILGVLALEICLSFCKFTYFPILFLLFLVPKEKFKNQRMHLLFKSLIILPNLIFTFINIFSFSGSVTTGSFYQIGDVISNPLNSFKIYFRTFTTRFQIDFICNLVNGFGWSTVWNNALLGYVAQVVFIIFYITANTDEVRKNNVPLKKRIFFTVLLIMIVGLVYSSLLIGGTYKWSDVIQGLQSRYFIPAVLLFILIISNDKIKLNVKDRNKFYFSGIIIVYSIVFFTLIYNYYV